jgi:spermidine synthase
MANFLFHESDPFAPVNYAYEFEQILCQRRTRYQELLIFSNAFFGRVLALDGVVQLTERDEHFYHEMLSQVALHAHPRPVDVLVIGGGDGGTVREVVKHKSIRRIVLVELDAEVIQVSREYLPTLSCGFADPRVEIVEAEGSGFLARSRKKFDIIIVDSTDPVGPAASLFTSRFLSRAFAALKPDGMFVAQTESLHFHWDFVREVQRKLAARFDLVALYTVPLATYAGNWWTFSIASKMHDPRKLRRKHRVHTRYYAEDVHRHAFLPASLYRQLMTDG